jgi:hypothetical protein
MTYQEILENIKNDKPFTFLRIGDGELLCADGEQGSNCDGHEYYPELGAHILHFLLHKQPMVLGLQPSSHGLYKGKAAYKQNWVNADVIHEQSEKTGLKDLTEALKGKNVVMVGNSSLKKLPFKAKHIAIPKKNAWLKYSDIQLKLKKLAEKDKQTIFLFSCGMLKVPLLEYLNRRFPSHTYIDAGSVFDPYVGVNSRSYHSKVDSTKI